MDAVTKQRRVLSRLLGDIPAEYPGCGILLWGSVMRGCERENSDLDIFVVIRGDGPIQLRQGWQGGRSHPENHVDGVCLDMTILPDRTLGKSLTEEPYLFWFFARSQILHDPDHLAKIHHDVARLYFDMHPEVEAIWRTNAEIVQQCKPKIKENPHCGITLPSWAEVAERACKTARQQ